MNVPIFLPPYGCNKRELTRISATDVHFPPVPFNLLQTLSSRGTRCVRRDEHFWAWIPGDILRILA